MLILTGKNLGERHREINLKVFEAANNKTHHNNIYQDVESDVEKLFRIDLASKNKHLDYILDVLKCGNNLYVTRALKSRWIFEDKFSDTINPTYLHYNVFPHMSERMKKKTLTAISLYVRNKDRVVSFYSYCINVKLKHLALKFLMYTSESFKMDLITSDDYFEYFNDAKCLKHFIGNSFALAVAYIEMHCSEYRNEVIHELRYLYFVSMEDYLDILEKYDVDNERHPDSIPRLGIRTSKDILKRHKSRIWKHAVYYVNKLNKSTLAKYFVSEDVKNLALLLLPCKSSQFWSMDFYHSYKFILDLIPLTEIFAYLKQIFSTKYVDEFEMNIEFYNLNYFEMLRVDEREAWALLHIEREKELFGSGNDYIWYKFVSYDKAFKAIKHYIFITPDNDKRSKIVNILVDTIRSQQDLMKLLNYYYERHVNESEEYKTSFLDAVITKHDIYAFDIDCWTPLNKLFYSLEVYTTHTTNWKLKEYIMRSMIYYILNNKEFSEDLRDFIDYERNFHLFDDIIKGLSEERRFVVVKYWLNYYAYRIKRLLEKPLDDKNKDNICEEICLVWSIIWCFHRDEKECPEIVLAYMKSNLNIYKDHPVLREQFRPMTEVDFVRLLKSDIQMAIEGVTKVKCNAYRWSFRLTRFLRKLKVYFSNDVSEVYLKYFLESFDSLKDAPFYIRTYRNIKMAVVAVFMLGNEQVKTSLLEKYVPKIKKIDYGNFDNFLLQVQKAICRLAYLSQPAIPLSNILKYITGDYVRFCLPMFNNYLVNLPMSEAFKFIYEIIDSPVSIQKHGLRLAFKCFSSHDLVQVILNVWEKTDNISLRMVLYETLFKRMVNEDGLSQKELYEVLKVYTTELSDQDHGNVFDLLASDDMPEEFKGDYIETAWQAVSKFPDKKINLLRKTSVVRHMKDNIHLVNRKFLRERIILDHVRIILHENRFIYSSQQTDLIKAKWDVTAAYIVSADAKELKDGTLKLARDILNKCLQKWHDQDKGVYITRQFCGNFLNTIHTESCINIGRYVNVIRLYRCILDAFSKSLPREELYLPAWKFNLNIQSRRVIYLHYQTHNKCTDYSYPCVFVIADAFAKEVRKLVQNMVDKKEFYYSFYTEMAITLTYVCEAMARAMDVSTNGFRILVSGHLSQFKTIETHVLAIIIIPKDPPENWEKRHGNVVNMLKQYNSHETRSHIVRKFDFAL